MAARLSGMFRNTAEALKYAHIKTEATGEEHIVHHCKDGSMAVLTVAEHQRLTYGREIDMEEKS